MSDKKNNRFNYNKVLMPLFVKDILYEYTDETHFLTAGNILEILETKYEINATRQTIYAYIEALIEAGLDIECVKSSQNKYHVLSREFETAELKILIDAVESSKSLSPSRSKDLVRKIADMGGRYTADYLIQFCDSKACNKTDNNKVMYIVSKINDAMASGRSVMFRYAEYINEHELQPRNGGEEYVVSPYRLRWKGDVYYLIGYSDKHKKIVSFRVDRICEVPSILKNKYVPEPEDFRISDYLNDSFRMSGDEKTVEVLFYSTGGVIDALVDRFGDDFSMLSEEKGMCRAVINTSVNNAFLAWIFGFEGKVRITGPHDVKEQYLRMVSKEMARL